MDDQWLQIFIKEQKLKYFDHLKRSESLGKPILEGKIEGKEKGEEREGSGIRTYGMFLQHFLTEVGRLAIDRNCFR